MSNNCVWPQAPHTLGADSLQWMDVVSPLHPSLNPLQTCCSPNLDTFFFSFLVIVKQSKQTRLPVSSYRTQRVFFFFFFFFKLLFLLFLRFRFFFSFPREMKWVVHWQFSVHDISIIASHEFIRFRLIGLIWSNKKKEKNKNKQKTVKNTCTKKKKKAQGSSFSERLRWFMLDCSLIRLDIN